MTLGTDFLRDCMTDPALVHGPVQIDEFNKQYCTRCVSADCTRSAANGMAFTRRVTNWKRDLFDAPPRASDNDPNYADIRAKKFTSIGTSTVSAPTPTVKSAPTHEIQFQDEPLIISPQQPIPYDGFQVVSPLVTSPQTPIAPESTPPVIPAPVHNQMNTPFAQGAMLGNPAPKTAEVVIESGGTFTFGDDK